MTVNGIEPTDIAVVSRQQLKDVVYERLRTALIDLTIEPGKPLREAALAAQLGVSKTPIREAIVRLERDGLVELAPYRGARARVYTAEDLRELCELREVIEGECARRATRGKGPIIKELEENVTDSEAALKANKIAKLTALLDRFDEMLLAQLDNRLLKEVVDRVRLHLRRIGRISMSVPGRHERSVAQHREILTAIESGKASTVDRILREHLRSVLDDQLVALGHGE
jgi:DNA-binding GntR family transcriptional regulator